MSKRMLLSFAWLVLVGMASAATARAAAATAEAVPTPAKPHAKAASGHAHATGPTGVPKLVADLSGGDLKARAAAYEGAARFGPEAIGPVAALLDHADPSVVQGAKIALEKIVGPTTRQDADKASVRRAARAALCGAVKSVKSRAGRDWLLWLLSYTGAPEAVTALLPLLNNAESADSALFALQCIGRDPVARDLVARTLAARLPKTTGNLRAGILDVLGAVGGKAAVPALMSEAKKPDPDCIPAIEALGRVGALPARNLLLAKIKAGQPQALDAYLRMVAKQPPQTAAAWYRGLLEGTGEPTGVCAALSGLAQVGCAADATAIMPYLAAERADVYGAAINALAHLRGKTVNRDLAAAVSGAEPPIKCGLLEVLSMRDAKAAMSYLERAIHDPVEEVHTKALELLGGMVNDKYESLFLTQAQSGSPAMKPVALQGYLKLADAALAHGNAAKALGLYHTALPLATADPDRATALQGMAKIADPASLPLVEPQVKNPALQGPAVACVLAIADKLKATDAARATALYSEALDATSDVDAAQHAAEGLRALGVTVDLAQRRGFVTKWKIVGPFPNTGFDAVFPPETEFNPSAEYDGAGGKKVKWTDYPVTHVMGITDLGGILDPKENVIAYARAEIEVAEAQDVQLKIGSDDGVICWLNGAKIHANNASRGLTIDQDVVPAKLNAGKNVILVKIVQGGGNWAFCVRVCKPDGNPLQFTVSG